MSSLSNRSDVAGTPSNSTAKAALAALFDFVAQRLARGTSGAGAATSAELASARDSLGVPMSNWLHNPDGGVYQRPVAATADDVYMDDRWYALTQTGTITPSQQSNPENGYRYALRLTQSQAAAQRMGRAQIVEGKDAIPLRGKTVTYGGRLKFSASANVRMAILAWTGAEDVVTSDVVNDWTSGAYTTGNFFASTSLTLIGTSSTALAAATAGDVSVTGTVPTGATNLIVLYWTEAAAAQNVTLDAWGLRLVESAYLNDTIRRSYAEELAMCQRRAVALSGFSNFGYLNANLQSLIQTISFPVTMAAVPAVTITSNGTLTSGWSTAVNGTTKDAFGLQVIANAAGAGGALGAAAFATCDL